MNAFQILKGKLQAGTEIKYIKKVKPTTKRRYRWAARKINPCKRYADGRQKSPANKRDMRKRK